MEAFTVTCQWHFWEGCRGWRRKGPEGPAAGDVGAKRLTPSKAADKSHRLLMSWKFVLSTRGAFWAKPPVSQCGSTLTPQKETVNFFFPSPVMQKWSQLMYQILWSGPILLCSTCLHSPYLKYISSLQLSNKWLQIAPPCLSRTGVANRAGKFADKKLNKFD